VRSKSGAERREKVHGCREEGRRREGGNQKSGGWEEGVGAEGRQERVPRGTLARGCF